MGTLSRDISGKNTVDYKITNVEYMYLSNTTIFIGRI